MKTFIIVFVVSLSFNAFAEESKGNDDGPCAKIFDACKNAQFKPGQVKDGTGLMANCVQPIMQDRRDKSGASIPLPNITAEEVAACKAKNPRFGSGKGRK